MKYYGETKQEVKHIFLSSEHHTWRYTCI